MQKIKEEIEKKKRSAGSRGAKRMLFVEQMVASRFQERRRNETSMDSRKVAQIKEDESLR